MKRCGRRRLLSSSCFLIAAPRRQLLGRQVILKAAEELIPHPFNGGTQAIRFLSLCWTGTKIHQAAEQIFGSLAAFFHHKDDRLFLVVCEWQGTLGQHSLHFILQLGQRVFNRRRRLTEQGE